MSKEADMADVVDQLLKDVKREGLSLVVVDASVEGRTLVWANSKGQVESGIRRVPADLVKRVRSCKGGVIERLLADRAQVASGERPPTPPKSHGRSGGSPLAR
jgi:hypothetical protein